MEALLAFAGSDAARPAPRPSLVGRTLFRRIVLISKEDVMSRRRLFVSCAVMAAMLLATWLVHRSRLPAAAGGRDWCARTTSERSDAREPGSSTPVRRDAQKYRTASRLYLER
jgi:hypothetical protein